MARKAEVILEITPDMSGLKAFEAQALATARRIRGELEGAFGRQGGRAGRGGSSAAPQGFWDNFIGGWGKAGGFGGAISTVLKYGAVYKVVELGSQAALAPVQMTTMAVQEGIKAWMEYQDVKAQAMRTARQPGLSNDFMGRLIDKESIDFLMKHKTTVEEIGQSIYELGSANFDLTDSLQAYQVPLKVNIALQGDITQTTQVMTQMLKIHGKQMDSNMSTQEKMVRLGGILYKTWEIEQVELSDLAAAYKYVAGTAAAMNIQAEELIPTLGFLSTYGMRGSIGGTGVNQWLTQTARNIKISKDGMLELEKAVRRGNHRIDLGLKNGASPLEILIQVSKAMTEIDSKQGKMQVVQALSDMFNIRGARPATLLSDVEKLGELLDHIADFKGAPTEELEGLYEAGLKFMENTPNAQLQIMQNGLQGIAIEGVNAAIGTSSFTDSLKELNQFIQDSRGIAESVGNIFHAAVKGAWNVASNKFDLSGGVLDWVRAPLEVIPTTGMTMDAIRFIIGAKEGNLENEQREAVDDAVETYRDAIKKNRSPEKAMEEAKRALNSSNLTYRQKHGKDLPSEVTSRLFEAIKNKKAEDFLLGGSGGLDLPGISPEYSFEEKGDTSANSAAAKRAKEFRRQVDSIIDGLNSYEDATYRVENQIGKLSVAEQRLSRLMNGRLLTNELIMQSDTQSSEKIRLHAALVSKLSDEIEELHREQVQLNMLAANAPDEDTRRDAVSRARQAGKEALAKEVERARAIEQQNMAREMPAELRFKRMMQDFNMESEQFQRRMRDYRIAIEEADMVLASLDVRERTFGQTQDTVRARVDALSDSIGRLSAAREKEEAEAAKQGERAEKILAILQEVERQYTAGNKVQLSDDQTSYLGSIFTPEQVKSAIETGRLYEWLRSMLGEFRGAQDRARQSVNDLTRSIVSQGGALTESERLLSTMALTKSMEELNRQSDLAQALANALGADWSTSSEHARMLADEIDNLNMQLDTLMSNPWNYSPEEFARKWNELSALREQAMIESDVAMPQAKKRLEQSWRMKMLETQSSWLRGDNREQVRRQIDLANKALDIEMQQLRSQYPWAESILDEYEEVMRKDNIMRPWIEARDRIRSQWSEMFSKLYTDLVSGGDNPWKAFVDSVFGSLQGQMLQMIVEKYLAPVFDFLASKETGIDPIKAAEVEASVQTTASLQMMDIAINETTIALQELAASAQGMSLGGGAGNGRTNMILSMLSGGAAEDMGGGGGGGLGGILMPKGKGLSVGNVLGAYTGGSMLGSLSGAIAGRDPQSSSVAGGIGGTIGWAVGGPIGGIVGGLIGGLFGKKKKKEPEQPPNRDIYGMPAFEYEAYLYRASMADTRLSMSTRNTYQPVDPYSARYAGAQINISVNGGDYHRVQQIINDALEKTFGVTAVAQANKLGSIYA